MIKLLFNKSTTLYIGILVVFSILICSSNYFRIPIDNVQDGIAYLIHGLILIAGVLGILYALSLNRLIFSIFFGPVLFLFLLSAYLLYYQNIILTSAIIDVTLNTEWNVTREYVNNGLILGIVILIIPVVFVYVLRLRNRQILSRKKYIHLVFSVLLMVPVYTVNAIRNNTYLFRAPLTIYSSVDEYLKIREVALAKKSEVAFDAQSGQADSLKVILIIGESLRNDHLGINGYSKNTTPELLKLDIIPLQHMRSLYSYTAASLPQLLTRADSLNDQRRFNEKSFISIFNRCNFKTTWIANQTPDYTYYDLAKEAEFYKNVSIENTSYSDKHWTDQNILNEIKNISADSGDKELIVLHSIGSHWYYEYRYPKQFSNYEPTLKSRSIYHNTEQEIINSYDNTVLFMDYFVSNVIKRFDDKNAILLFVSDHGELLGEDGNWLHAIDHDQLYNSAGFIWMSDKYKMRNKDKYESLLSNTNKNWTTSFLFHSILCAGNIQTNSVLDSQNIFVKQKK